MAISSMKHYEVLTTRLLLLLLLLLQVWGLDFGDCHKSMFAHQDTITAVAFVKDTHYAFRCGAGFMLQHITAL
jgi:hypothetical protein